MTALAPVPLPRLRAGIYGRLSVAKDASDYRHDVETPVERQFYECVHRCEREDWEVVKSYPDDGYSGWTGKRRPGFEELLGDVQAGLLDVVVVWKLDRLSRNLKDLQRILEACQAHGTRIVSVTQGLDTATPMMGKLLTWLLGLLAEIDSDNTSERVKLAIKYAKQAAERDGRRWHWGRRAFGRAPDGETQLRTSGKLTWKVIRKPKGGGPPVEEEVTFAPEADWLEGAGRRVDADESLESAARWLYANGVRSVKAGERARLRPDRKRRPVSGRITAQGLRQMLLDPRNEDILGPDLYWSLHGKLTDGKRRTQHGSARVHLLTGWFDSGEQDGFLCGGCGSLLRSRGGRRGSGAKFATYYCPGCGKVARSAEEVDELVRDNLFHRLGCWHVESTLQDADVSDGQQELVAERQGLQARLDQLDERLAARLADPGTDLESAVTADDLTRAKGKVRLRLAEIDRQLTRHREQTRRRRSPILHEALEHATHREKLEAFWESLTVAQRRELLKAAGLVRVLLHPGKPRARRLDPSTVERFWRKRDGELEPTSGRAPGSRNPHGQVRCKCGCGRLAAPGKEWQPGHHPNRGAAHYNARKTHCPQGHPYDEANTYARDGGRQCRACKGEQAKASRARRAS